MSILNLKTDLKSVKWDKAPYVTKDINNPPNSNGIGLEIRSRVDDLTRITKTLADGPGLKFAAHQAILAKGDKGILKGAVKKITKTAQIIASTLAQIPVNGTGTHFVQGFNTDTYLKPTNGPRSAFARLFGAGGVEGAPLAKRGQLITGEVESLFPTGSYAGPTGSLYTPTISGSINLTDVPEETLHTTPTNNSSGGSTPVSSQTHYVPSLVNLNKNNAADKSIKDVIERNTESSRGDQQWHIPGVNKSKLQDFRENFKTLDEANDEVPGNTYSFNYNNPKINKETRVGLGNQGASIEIDPKLKYTTDTGLQDKVNALDVSTSPITDPQGARDFIRLAFQIITPEENYYLHFRSFLTSFDDNFTGDWSNTQYIGRADQIRNYKSFDRDITIGFKVAAMTRQEMQPIYRKINTLASVTAPTYGGGSFMRGSFAKVTVGDYINSVPGIISSVKFTWQTDYPWEISMSNPELAIDDDMQILPHVLDCSVSFKPIHDFLPQTGIVPFSTNSRGNSTGKAIFINAPG